MKNTPSPGKEHLLSGQSLEESFQMSVLNEHAIVSVCDQNGAITYANEKFIEISGYSVAELTGADHRILNSALHSTEFFADIWSTIKSGKTWTGEIRNKRKDGSFYWVKSTMVPYLDEQKKPTKFVSVQTDITDIKASQEAKQLAATFELINDEVYMFDPDTLKLFYLNKNALRETNWSTDDVPRKTLMDLNAQFSVPHKMFEPASTRKAVEKLQSSAKGHFTYQFAGRAGKWFEAKFQLVKPEFRNEYVIVSFLEITEQITTEQQARRFHTTLDSIHNEVYMFRPGDLKFFYVNKAAIRETGWSMDELLDMTPVDLKPEFTESAFRSLIAPLELGQQAGTVFNTIHRRKDGSTTQVEVTLDYIAPDDEEPRFVAVVKDISDRISVLNELSQLKRGFDLGHNQIYMFWQDNLQLIYMNKAALRAVDLDKEKYLGESIRKHLEELQFERLMERAAPLITGEKRIVVSRVFDKGNNRHLEETLQLITPENDRARFIVIYQDVSDRIESDKQIQRLKSSLDIMDISIQMYRPDSLDFIYMNKGALRILGWTEDEYKTKSVHDISPRFDEERFRKHIEPLKLGKATTLVYETTDGNNNPIEITEQLLDPDGEDARIVAIVRDITERKLVDKKKSEFVSTVSHELRTPLTSIIGALGLIQGGAIGEVPEKVATMTRLAYRNSQNLADLVDDILQLEKISSGQQEFEFLRLDVSEFLHEAVDRNRMIGARFDVKFKLDDLKFACFVMADPDRLMQVMSNLLSNAAKFSEKGDAVNISAELVDKAVRISVKDSGSGIPKAAQSTIFERFTQADSSDTRKKGGTGLGLSIAKEIVEKHGGTIGFESVEGEGSTFYFDLDVEG